MSDPSEGTLKRLKQTYKPAKGKIIPHVQRHLLKKSKDSDRDTAHVHPSELAKDDWCRRRAWLRITEAQPNKRSSNASSKMEMVFEEGHNIHGKWHGWIYESEGLDLYGKWKCRKCGRKEFGWGLDLPSIQAIPACGHDWEYRELPFEPTSEFRIMGHTDGLVWVLSEGRCFLLEVKSIGIGTLRFEAPKLYWDYTNGELDVGKVWMNIKRPFLSHMKQGLLYLFFLRDQYPQFTVPDLDVDEIIFLYDYKPTQDVRELPVKLSPTTMPIIEPLLDDVRTITRAVDEGTEVERPEWAKSVEGIHCASCEYSEACWGVAPEQPVAKPRRRRVSKSTSAKRRRAIG